MAAANPDKQVPLVRTMGEAPPPFKESKKFMATGNTCRCMYAGRAGGALKVLPESSSAVRICPSRHPTEIVSGRRRVGETMTDIRELLREAASVIEALSYGVEALCSEGGIDCSDARESAKKCRDAAEAVGEPAVPEWLPIETAPRQRNPMIAVMGILDSGYVTDPWCVWWQEGEWQRWPHKEQPTHWIPLPATGDSHHE